jgi:tRNA U34 5-methylaminomethyl-2-thiouridine-forming methyltransferase MnmC
MKNIVQSSDGSFTMFSEEFGEHYHSLNDGALSESLYKHIIPALSLVKKDKLQILDINFGLGFNTFTTLYSLLNSGKEVEIHSPEIDVELVKSLSKFPYPNIFNPLEEIILSIAETGKYESEKFRVYVHFGDARDFLKNYSGVKFDIVYQDAFSPQKSPSLWTVEYFSLIRDVVTCQALLTTYSTSTPVRLALYENGFRIYSYQHDKVREGTIASIVKIEGLQEVDMERKIKVSSKNKALQDSDYL